MSYESDPDGRLRLQQLEAFISEHGNTIRTALETRSREMNKAADEAMEGYNAVKDDPEKRAAQDQSQVTTRGLLSFARIFTDNAGRASRARAALDLLEDTE